MKVQKIGILVIAGIVIIVLALSFYNSSSYVNLKSLEIKQVFFIDKVEFIAKNPTKSSITFPKTEFDIYLDDVYFGKLDLEKTIVPKNTTLEIPGDFILYEENIDTIIQSGSLFEPQIVRYEGNATLNFLFGENKMPFTLKKQIDKQDVSLG